MKRFITDSKFNNDISVKVEDGAAFFYSQSDINYFHHRDRLIKEGLVSDDEEAELNPFYWIPVENINDQVRNHLLKKSWFRKEMLDYIESELNK